MTLSPTPSSHRNTLPPLRAQGAYPLLNLPNDDPNAYVDAGDDKAIPEFNTHKPCERLAERAAETGPPRAWVSLLPATADLVDR